MCMAEDERWDSVFAYIVLCLLFRLCDASVQRENQVTRTSTHKHAEVLSGMMDVWFCDTNISHPPPPNTA